MKAILIKEPKSFAIVDVPVPEPREGEVLVRVHAVSLCNQHDVKVWDGSYKKLKYLEYGTPGFPGHEGVGEIVELGPEVSQLSVGDQVAMSGLGGPPLYQEYVTRSASEVAVFTPRPGYDEMAMCELLGCVHHGISKVKGWKNRTVLISGLGPAGLAALQIARAKGAQKVLGTDLKENRLKLAEELGADLVLNAGDPELLKRLEEAKPEIVFETTGNAKAYRVSVGVAQEAVILFGYTEKDFSLDPWPIFDRELAIFGSKWLTTEDLRAVVSLIENGQIKTHPLVSARLRFEEYPVAIKLVRSGAAIKIIMKP